MIRQTTTCWPSALLLFLIGTFAMDIITPRASLADDNLGTTSSWVPFNSFSYAGTDNASALLTAPDKQFINPILAGFHPDPSICRVGDDFYLVNSSFCYFPGIPIFHSRDLVNWTQIGYVMNRASDFASFKPVDASRGLWAPTIRYHDGTFYVICTLQGGTGNFFVTAKNPAGPWSDPTWIREINGIDPSFFFDDDGKTYITWGGTPPNNRALYTGHAAIHMMEFDLAAGKLVGPDKILVNGGTDISKQPRYIEGPHLLKRNSVYYLIAAEGGTEIGHSEVVFRADNPWGPYTSFSGNPILTQRQLPATRPDPITCTGHADFVQLQNGQWWAVFLGCQPYEQTWFNTGRQTFLLPVTWENDWPIILKDDAVVPRVLDRPALPAQPAADPPTHGTFKWTDNFDGNSLNLRWNFLRVPTQQWYSLTEIPGSLLIAPRPQTLTEYDNPSLIACRQQHADFSASVSINVRPATARCDAGLVAFQNETHYFFLGVHLDGGQAKQIFLEQMSAPASRGRAQPAQVLATAPLPDGSSHVELQISATGRPYSFKYRVDTGDFKSLADKVDGSILSTDVAGGFQGVMVGMFARTSP